VNVGIQTLGCQHRTLLAVSNCDQPGACATSPKRWFARLRYVLTSRSSAAGWRRSSSGRLSWVADSSPPIWVRVLR